MNNHGDGFLAENLDKISTTTTKVTTIDSTFRTPPKPTVPSSSSMIETNTSNNTNNHNHHYSNEPNQIGQQQQQQQPRHSNGSNGFFVKQPEKFLSTTAISLSEPLSPTTITNTNTGTSATGGSTSKMANNNKNIGVGVGGENGGGSSSSSSSSLIKTITAEVYQQFDQLVTTTNNKKNTNNNNNNNDSNSNKLTKNNDFGLNKRSKTNSLSGLHRPQTNQVNRRDRIKSFIEFDDNYDDYDDDDDGDGDGGDWNYRTDGQRLASKDHHHHHHHRRSQLRKSSPSLQNEYRNELINVFEPHNITIPTKICHENVDDNVDVDGGDDVEWNDFQTSEPAPPPNDGDGNDGVRLAHDRNNNNDDDDQDLGDNSTSTTTTDSTNSDNSDNNNNLNNNFDEANLDLINGGDGGAGGDDPECDNMFLYGKLNRMEEEQEFLNNSLIALTSHFAQVQLRLRQIVEAKDLDQGRRETLLAELETFANRGIPELMLSTTAATTGNPSVNHSTNNLKRSVSMATSLMADDVFDDDDDQDDDDDGRSQKSMATNHHIDDLVAMDNNNDDQEAELDGATIDGHHHHHQGRFSRPRYWSYSSQMDEDSLTQHSLASMATNMTKNSSASKLLITEEKLERQRTRQKELITQLKEQLEDLERYAYETGELNSLPSSMLLERQNAIIEQLKSKLPVLSIDEIDNLTPDQLRNKVDHAIKELVNPVIMKEQLVTQLKTQVTDLERFIEFLQQGGAKMKHKHKRMGGGGSYLMKFLKKTSLNSVSSSTTNTKTIHQDDQANHLDGHRRHNRISSNDSDRRRNSDERNNNNSGAATTRSKGGAAKSGGKSRSQHHSQHTTTTTTTMDHNGRNSQSAAESADSIFKRILSLLHMFAWTQLGTCASFSGQNNNHNTNHNHLNDDRTRPSTTTRVPPPFQQNILKRTTPICARHWGDLRAHLEMVINSILDFYKEQNMKIYETTSTSSRPANINEADDDDNVVDDYGGHEDDLQCSAPSQPAPSSLMIDNYYAFEQMTILVRKELSISLRNLIQHGMIGCVMADAAGTDMATADSISAAMMINPSSSIPITTVGGYLLNFGLGCFNSRSGLIGGGRTPSIHTSRRPMHAWQLILYYYELKHGNKFRSTPTRRLSQSFGLQVMAGVHTNPKHSLLAAIDDIIDSHTRLKRSLDSHFKAFVSIALNQQMLSKWLRLILRNPTIMTDCYEKWSYTASTGFEDALRQLDKLSELKFCLPTDLAVRQLQSIHDAF